MIEDAELLRRYAEEKSEEAFAELVRRRIGLVYSVALRHTHDAHRAEDVTQAVFNALARKAGVLARRPVLVGWLYRSAQFAASDAVRVESRRQAREQEAYSMQEITREGTEPDWEKLQPVLGEVLSALDELDRDAVLLRFFDGQPFAEIGRKLHLTENTARMRVERALDKLHTLLARRGVTSTTAALGLALAGQATAAAPAGLAASITGVALAGTAATSVGLLATFMGMTKIQVGIVGALAVAGAAGYFAQAETNAGLHREISVLRGQQQDVAALRTENQQLAATATEVEMLRRDDLELQRLAQNAAVAKKAMEENARLAQVRETQRKVQAEIDRMNREGNALVEQFKALQEKSQTEALPDAKAELDQAKQKKMNEIRAKMAEVTAFKAANGLASAAEAQVWTRANAIPGSGAIGGEVRALQGATSGSGGMEFRRKPPAVEEAANPPQP